MKFNDKTKVLVLAGTGDARELTAHILPIIAAHNGEILVSVVGENAAGEYRQLQIPVRCGAMSLPQMKTFFEDEKISVVVDATHPFAAEVSQNAISAADEAGIMYLRYERPETELARLPSDLILPDENDLLLAVKDHETAAGLVVSMQKRAQKKLTVMLTTGAKSLEMYAREFSQNPDIEMVARLLPTAENLELCARNHVQQKNIVAMQGPFHKELNKELFIKYNVDVLVTKESGPAGSTDEKILAAGELGVKTIVVGRPAIIYRNQCRSFEEAASRLVEFLEPVRK